MRIAGPLLALLFAGCGARAETAKSPSSPAAPVTETRVEKRGGKTTVVTVTKRVVEAPAPPRRTKGDPWPSDPLVKFNVDRLNDYRRKHGAPPLAYDAKISTFALAGSRQLAKDHTPHAHFNAKIKAALGDPEAMKGGSGFGSRAAENQGDWNGIPQLDADPARNGRKQIEITLQLMYDEGPGGGHHDNMLNPKFSRVGVGLVYVGPKMYLTNDFSD
jgi:hypothetical protein